MRVDREVSTGSSFWLVQLSSVTVNSMRRDGLRARGTRAARIARFGEVEINHGWGPPRPITPFAGFGVMGRMTVGDAVSARMASGDTADTLEVVDVAQVLARSVLKDKTLDGRAALCGMDAAFLL